MPVSFSKDGPLGEFDGFDATAIYQMVPERDRRDITVRTQRECVLEIGDSNVASMANFIRFSGPPFSTPLLTTGAITLPASARVQFSIMGKAAGHTELTFSENNTQVPQSLLISVKSKLPKKYGICFLKDTRRSTVRPKPEAELMMQRVSQTFLQQANIDLQFSPPSLDVTVAKDLGNPLFVGKSEVKSAIVMATPASFFHLDVVIYCCWNVDDVRPAGANGVTVGKLAFVQDGGAQNNATSTFGHEVGHALGLHHNGNIDRLMFFSDATRSSKLSQFEIDTLNPSGTQ